jgi:hypothetical protein
MTNISGELIIGLSSIFCTGVGVALAYVFKINCSEMSMCYCFNCKRDVRGENEFYQLEHENQSSHLADDHILSLYPPPQHHRTRENNVSMVS